jgi:hypothetical protein
LEHQLKDSVFFTILAGVTVFVIGQFILKLVLEPLVSFKESLGDLSAFFLRNRAKITNANATLEMQDEVKRLGSTLISKKQAIPFYRFFAFCLRMPSEKKIIESCQLLNSISAEMVKETSRHQGSLQGSVEISMELQKISDLLGVRLDYSQL